MHYLGLSQLDVLDKREFQSLKSSQNLEISLPLIQTEIACLKTQPDWLPFFPPETIRVPEKNSPAFCHFEF
jgi:hypothetical protein